MKIYAFDLDGTLTESKENIDAEMRHLLNKLLKKYYVIVASGADFKQIKKQLTRHLSLTVKEKLSLITMNGAVTYKWNREDLKYKPVENKLVFSEASIRKITKVLGLLKNDFAWMQPTRVYGSQFEIRKFQVTFSPLGKDAPAHLKRLFDTDLKHRMMLRERLLKILPQFDVNIGGLASMDITLKNVTKALGLVKLSTELQIEDDDILYIGDRLFPGGNDYSIIEAGFNHIQVDSVDETKVLIKGILNDENYFVEKGKK